jgi:hypothetical protein
MAVIFIGLTGFVSLGWPGQFFTTLGWPGLILFGGITFIVVLVLSFFAGLTSFQRSRILDRVRIVLAGSRAE